MRTGPGVHRQIRRAQTAETIAAGFALALISVLLGGSISVLLVRPHLLSLVLVIAVMMLAARMVGADAELLRLWRGEK